jgi:hypothetical protein
MTPAEARNSFQCKAGGQSKWLGGQEGGTDAHKEQGVNGSWAH